MMVSVKGKRISWVMREQFPKHGPVSDGGCELPSILTNDQRQGSVARHPQVTS
jgi:hypothetical protein